MKVALKRWKSQGRKGNSGSSSGSDPAVPPIAQNEIPETVREHYKTLSHHASECIQCGQCETNCPFGVAIIEQMEKAAEKFGY